MGRHRAVAGVIARPVSGHDVMQGIVMQGIGGPEAERALAAYRARQK